MKSNKIKENTDISEFLENNKITKLKKSKYKTGLNHKQWLCKTSGMSYVKCKNKRRTKKKKLKEFSEELNKNLPLSEKWFQSLYEEHNLKLDTDLYNKPFRVKYIPDVLNRNKRYIIEIDGNIHLTKSQIEIDKKKDEFYFKCGMLCIRIIAFDLDSYISGMKKLLEYRKTEYSEQFKKLIS